MPHPHFTEIPRVVLVEQDPVVVHASGVSPTAGMLPVLPDSPVPGAQCALSSFGFSSTPSSLLPPTSLGFKSGIYEGFGLRPKRPTSEIQKTEIGFTIVRICSSSTNFRRDFGGKRPRVG